MAKKIVENGTRFWLDPEGSKVPETYVDKVDKKRDALVERTIKKIENANLRLKQLKEKIEMEVDRFLDGIAEQYGEDWKGNALLRNFDQSKEVQIKYGQTIGFDERLQVARQLIDRCIEKWSEGSDMKIRMLVNQAFKVDKKGQLDAKLILSLRQIKIKDNEWKQAMELIADSVKIENRRKYFIFKRKDVNGEWQTISMNFSYL